MNDNLLQRAIGGFREILEPVFLAAESPEAAKALLESIGLPMPDGTALNIPQSAKDGISEFTDTDPEDAGIDAFADTLVQIDQVFAALEGFIRTVAADDAQESVDELVHTLINLLTLNWLYHERNNTYLIFEMLKAIEKHGVHHGGFIEFFKKGIGFLVNTYCGGDVMQTEEDARKFSNGVLLPITIVMGKIFGAEASYGWDPDPASTVPLADQVAARTGNFLYKGETEHAGNTVKGAILVSYAVVPKDHQGPAMVFRLKGDASVKAPLAKGLILDVAVSGPDVIFAIPGIPGLPGSTDASVTAKLSHDSSKADFKAIIGSTKGTHLSFGTISAELKANPKDFSAKLSSKKAALQLKAKDGFLSKITPKDGLKLTFELGLGWSNKKGLFFEGSGGLSVKLPIHETLGPLTLQTLTLGLKGGADSNGKASFEAETSLGFSFKLGGLVATVDRLGMEFALKEPGGEAAEAPLEVDVKFKHPTGVGLAIDSEVAKGGGFLLFDPDNGYYAGGLQLTFKDQVEMAAVAIITTKLPEGEEGFSILIAVNITFTPPWSLGLGFFMSGIGFLMGVHHTLNVEALRAGVKNGTLDNILFPDNLIQNASRIISDMRTVFPAKKEQAFIGLLARITWGEPKLLVIDLGLALEVSNPTRLAILGVLKADVPHKDASVLKLQVNFLGIIDFKQQYLSFDASLFNSRLLGFTLEGDMAVRLNWGDQGGFLLSVGGFHPAYTPPAHLMVPSMKRITMSLLSGNPMLKMSNYFAITSNTVQFGASIDFLFKVSKFKVVGYFGYDVLFQFNPFYFEALVKAGVDVRVGSSTLFAIALEFELTGPTPWTARGFAKFKVFIFSVKVRFCKTWGERREIVAPSVALLGQALTELGKAENWTGKLPSRRFMLVSLREAPLADGEVLLESGGSLEVSQSLIPLDIEMTRYGQNQLRDLKKLRIKAMKVEGDTLDHTDLRANFAPAAFKEMSDEDKLKAPSFVKEKSGIRLKGVDAVRVNYALNRIVSYEVRSSDFDRESGKDYGLNEPIDMGKKHDDMTVLRAMAGAGAIQQSPLSQSLRRDRARLNRKAVVLGEERFQVVNKDDLTAAETVPAGTKAQADDRLRDIIRRQPRARGKIQIISQFEMA